MILFTLKNCNLMYLFIFLIMIKIKGNIQLRVTKIYIII